MKNSIKRAQSQACLNFAERKNFRLQAKHKILMTLVALFTMTAGAWADPNILAPTITGDREFYESVEVTMICTSPNADIYYTVNGKDPRTLPDNQQIEYSDPITLTETTTIMARAFDGNDWSAMVEVTFTKQTGPKVTWDAATKTGSFEMPAYDVEIAPIYASTAKFATEGNLVLTPTAIEGIYAESTDAIVTAGTVAKIGETENPQGIVMYAVTSTNEATAPALTAFSADVPTAKDITIGSEVLVWYYIKGADTPEGEKATAENTFNDSEICATPITVTVLSNKFDIQFKAANDNTIEAGKATVTVGGTAETVTEGKLTGVKMGSEVKVKAKDGYKFRKAEAKKGGMLSFEIGGHVTATIYYVEGETWEQAIQNHPEENSAWSINYDNISANGANLFAGDNYVKVSPNSTIDPNANYHLVWT